MEPERLWCIGPNVCSANRMFSGFGDERRALNDIMISPKTWARYRKIHREEARMRENRWGRKERSRGVKWTDATRLYGRCQLRVTSGKRREFQVRALSPNFGLLEYHPPILGHELD